MLSDPLLRDILEVVLFVLLWPLAAFGLIDLSVQAPAHGNDGQPPLAARQPS